MTLDWQTIVVTIVALGAALVVVRRFLPARRRSNARPGQPAAPVACEHCETGAKATRAAAAGNGSAGADADDARRQRRRPAPRRREGPPARARASDVHERASAAARGNRMWFSRWTCRCISRSSSARP